MTQNRPTKLSDLSPEELYRSALEDFALNVDDDEKSNKTALLAAFTDGGVDWAQYVEQHPEVAPEPAKNVVTAGDNKHASVEDEVPATISQEERFVPRQPVTAAPPVYQPDQTYLIKMNRPNVAFQTRGHTFTQEHPYAIVSADDADYILSHEDGFSIASPSELKEYYG